MLSSPPSPIRVPLTISTVTNALVKLRRSTSKAEIIDFTSGEPKTHSSLQGEGATSSRKVPVEQNDLFSCMGAVDVPKLLRGSRASLLERAEFIGANVLVDERCVRLWKVLVFLLLIASQPAGSVQYVLLGIDDTDFSKSTFVTHSHLSALTS